MNHKKETVKQKEKMNKKRRVRLINLNHLRHSNFFKQKFYSPIEVRNEAAELFYVSIKMCAKLQNLYFVKVFSNLKNCFLDLEKK